MMVNDQLDSELAANHQGKGRGKKTKDWLSLAASTECLKNKSSG